MQDMGETSTVGHLTTLEIIVLKAAILYLKASIIGGY